MSVKEAVEALGIGRTKFYDLVKAGKIHPIRNPLYAATRGPVRIDRAEVDAIKREYGIA